MMIDSFRYRLTISMRAPGLFRFDEATKEFVLQDGHEVEIVARDADHLLEATHVHFDGYDFPTKQAARAAGERLRLRIRILDALLGLGLSVPIEDKRTGGVSDTVKSALAREHDAVVVDSIAGLAVHPNDGRHVEYVMHARMDVHKSDGEWLLAALRDLWQQEFACDDASMDALAILGLATRETSPRAAFLMTYLAVETLLPRAKRSEAAQRLLAEFQSRIANAGLGDRETTSLQSSIANLRVESFPSALTRFAASIVDPPEIDGRQVSEFLSECISVRNAIAHKANLDPLVDLQRLSAGLRTFALTVIWTNNQLPPVSIDVPGDKISFKAGNMSIRVL